MQTYSSLHICGLLSVQWSTNPLVAHAQYISSPADPR